MMLRVHISDSCGPAHPIATACYQVGSVSIKNTKNILIKNIGDASLGAICWWLLGYGVAFGESEGELERGSNEHSRRERRPSLLFALLRRWSVEVRAGPVATAAKWR